MEQDETGWFDQKQHEVLAVALSDKYIALGTNNGYKIFTMNPIKLIKNKDLTGGVGMIGFYRQDKIIWFVGGGETPAAPDNEFRLWDNHNDEQLWKILQKKSIKGVCIKPEYLLISLSDKVYFYTLPLSEKIISFETINNPFGVIAIAQNEDVFKIAFLDNEINGSLVVYDYNEEKVKWKINGGSHEEFFITSLTLNSTGTLLASASSEGCSVHLYCAEEGTRLKDFTRSSTPSTINFLKFELNNSRLLVNSEAGTVHIFMIDPDMNSNALVNQPKNNVSMFSFLGGIIPYLGKIGSYWKFRTPESYKIASMPDEGSLIVLSSNGKVYLANIDVEEGGEAILESLKTLTDCLVVHNNSFIPEDY